MTAVLSTCGTYRYALRRSVVPAPSNRSPILFIMLNPSTADADVDDATIRRCRGFTSAWGYDGLTVVNLYALRSTNPAALWSHADPVGPVNDTWIEIEARRSPFVVVAWGANARPDRVREVVDMLQVAGVRLRCLGITKSGAPRHPLYVRSDQPLIDWNPQ